MRKLLLVTLAQVVSLLGTLLAGFGLGIWVYQRSGSMTLYGLSALATLGPTLLAMPVAGALVDRWSPRVAMVVGHAGAGLCALGGMILVALDALGVGSALGLVAATSIFNALQLPGLSAAVALLVPADRLGRANGVVQLGTALAGVLAPALAGALLAGPGLWSLLVIEALTFAFAMTVLLSLRLPAAPPRRDRRAAPSLLGAWIEGFRYIRARPGFLALILIAAVANFNLGMVQVLVPPLVLGFASVKTLGQVVSVGGLGLLAGGGLLMLWGGPRRLVHGALGFLLLQGLVLMLGGLRASVPLVAAGAFGVFFAMPLIAGCIQTLWQRKVPPAIQGSVFAARVVLAQSTLPLAFVIGGPLAEHAFEPLMAEGGALAGSLGAALGVGPGRGVALLFMVLALLSLAAVMLGGFSARLRRLEDELEDSRAAPLHPAPSEPPEAMRHGLAEAPIPRGAGDVRSEIHTWSS
jgi:MFS family permease